MEWAGGGKGGEDHDNATHLVLVASGGGRDFSSIGTIIFSISRRLYDRALSPLSTRGLRP